MIKPNMSHYYRKFIEKSRSLFANLSSNRRIDFSLFMVGLRGRFMRLSMSPPYRKFVASLFDCKTRIATIRKLSPVSLVSRRKHLFSSRKSLLASANKARRSSERKSYILRLFAGRPRPSCKERIRPTAARPVLVRPFAGRRIDVALFVATLIVLAIVGTSYFRRTVASAPVFVNIFVSKQYWEMFGNTANSFIREFEDQNPGFRILVAGEEPPDIVFFDDGEFAVLVEAAALASLSPYIYTETDEDQWVLPLVSFVDLFFYNIDILQDAGNDRPPRTLVEFLATARSVAETSAAMRGEIFPFAMGLSDADPLGVRRDFYPWVWALGGEIHSGFTEGGNLALTGPTTSTINFLAEMNREGLIAPGTFETTGRERLEQFAEGRIAMMIASARDIVFVRDSEPRVNFDITAVPAMALGRNRLGISGIYAGISSTSTQPDMAWAFLVFVAGRSHLLASALGAVPGSFFISFPSRYIEEDPMYSKAWDIFEAADIVEFPSGDISEKEAGLVIREMLFRAFEAVD